MTIRRVSVEAPAKVNLWLRVLAREESGFHGLETLFCAIDLCDTVEVETSPEPGVTLVVEGSVDTGPPEGNLAVVAAKLALRAMGRAGDGLRVHLRKRIPSAAGLGGGSSDAATALRAVNALYDEPLSGAELLSLGIELGSDVPFFLCGSPLALGWSRGERLLALPPLPAAPLLVAHPGEPVPTADAFHRIAERREGGYRPRARSVDLASLSSWSTVASLAENDFEPFAVERIPRLAEGLRVMREAGARIALLAGSGGSLFGVFGGEGGVEAAEEGVRGVGFTTWRGRTITRLPAPRLVTAG